MQTETLTLRPLQVSDEESFRAAVEEFRADDTDMTFAFCFDPAMEFAACVRCVNCWSIGDELTDGFVPNTFLVAVVEGRIVGRVSLRHELNDFLSMYGGHVGFCVVPSARRKGYASEMLNRSVVVESFAECKGRSFLQRCFRSSPKVPGVVCCTDPVTCRYIDCDVDGIETGERF